jgi:hypothetical protein
LAEKSAAELGEVSACGWLCIEPRQQRLVSYSALLVLAASLACDYCTSQNGGFRQMQSGE